MPEFTGSTDEKHVFTLPSEIERVRWRRNQAAPTGEVGLQIRTIFCAQGSQMEIRIEDAQGTVHNTFSGELPGDELNLNLRVPKDAVGGLLAKVRMPNHGLSAESEALRIVDPVRLVGPRWSKDTIGREEIVDLTAEARGAPDGRRAVIRLFKHIEGTGAPVPYTQIRQRVEGGAVQAKYMFEYPGDTDDLVPEWEADDGYTPPTFFFRVNISGVTADSGMLEFRDTVELRKEYSGQPAADIPYEVTLPDGSTREGQSDAEGTAVLEDVPPGPVKVNWNPE